MMFRGLHLWRVVAAAAVTLALLAGFGAWSGSRSNDASLATALAAHPQVADVTVESAGGELQAVVNLGPVPNLREAYLEISRRAEAAAQGRPVALRVTDRRSPQLLADYYALHYYVAEAMARGTFPETAQSLLDAGSERGLDHVGFYVDPDRIYLQLHRGDDYLYEIIPRNGSQPGATGGGSAETQMVD